MKQHEFTGIQWLVFVQKHSDISKFRMCLQEYSETSIENLSKANLPAKSSFLEWQSRTSESPSSKKNTSTCTRQKTTALTQEVTRHQVGSDDEDDEVSVSHYVSGLFSGKYQFSIQIQTLFLVKF